MKHLPLLFLFLVLANSAGAQGLFGSGYDSEIPPDLEAAYVRGLNFLKKTQKADGTWEGGHYSSEPGVVGLAVVAMLAHGDDPEKGPYAENIAHGIDFIVKQMNTGNGYIGNSMYNHGFATLALAEAYGVVGDKRIGPALKKAVDLILSSQKKNPFNAWRYSPDSNDADTTVSGACFVALIAAANAGIKVPQDSIDKALKYYESCQSDDGGIGYSGAGGANSIRTSIGMLAYSLSRRKQSQAYKSAAGYMSSSDAAPEESYYFYGLYYMSQAFFHASPELWERWNTANIKSLLKTQGEEGSWTDSFGTTFATSAALLSIALNYRYLPIYER